MGAESPLPTAVGAEVNMAAMAIVTPSVCTCDRQLDGGAADLSMGRRDSGTVDPLMFRALMRRFATGVTMVTSSGGSEPGGVTVNAFTALSLAPPQVLVCLDNGSRTLDQILAAGSFAVNVLGTRQQELARRFADKSLSAAQRFAHLPTWPLPTGAPAIQGSIALLDCRLVQTWRSGDHTVLVGEVGDGSVDGEDGPLIFYAGGYRRLADR